MTQKPPIALEDRDNENGRLFSPSAGRNLEPIMQAFKDFDLTEGRVIEFGSGTGQHAAHLVQAHQGLDWLATDPDAQSRVSCGAWAAHYGLSDRMKVADVDLLKRDQRDALSSADVVYASNVIHISPISVLEGLLKVCKSVLTAGGRLVLYGPFRRNGVHNSDGNANFDESLKARNPEWGVRDLEQEVVPRAANAGLVLRHVRDMPANNYFVVFEKEV